MPVDDVPTTPRAADSRLELAVPGNAPNRFTELLSTMWPVPAPMRIPNTPNVVENAAATGHVEPHVAHEVVLDRVIVAGCHVDAVGAARAGAVVRHALNVVSLNHDVGGTGGQGSDAAEPRQYRSC